MPDTIESFVAKLQAEGVEAGREAADKLLTEAKQQADKIIRDADAQAERITAAARSEAESTLARSRTELELAARDVVLRLREALGRALRATVAAEVKEKLTDSEFLSKMLHDLVMLYAKADIERKEGMKINVTPELHDKLADWALQEMTRRAEQAGMGIDLKGDLAVAGFEYNISGATIEVTLESVVETIGELIGPRLREIVNKAAGEMQTPFRRQEQAPQGSDQP